MDDKKLLREIKKMWERETGLRWNRKRWEAMEKILTGNLFGISYLHFLLAKAGMNVLGLSYNVVMTEMVKELPVENLMDLILPETENNKTKKRRAKP